MNESLQQGSTTISSRVISYGPRAASFLLAGPRQLSMFGVVYFLVELSSYEHNITNRSYALNYSRSSMNDLSSFCYQNLTLSGIYRVRQSALYIRLVEIF